MRREAVRVRLLGGFGLSLGRHNIEADRWRLKKAAGLVKLLALGVLVHGRKSRRGTQVVAGGAREERGHASDPLPYQALVRAGRIAWEQGDYKDCVSLSQEGLNLSRELGYEAGFAAALYNLGWAALLADDPQKATVLAEEAITLARAVFDVGVWGRRS